MITFIIPKNSGLQKCRRIARSYSSIAELIEVRGEDVPEFVYRAGNLEKRVIGITGEDLFEEYRLRNRLNGLEVVEKIEWYDEDFIYKKPALCLLGPESINLDLLPREITICINSKYRELSKKAILFLGNRGFNCRELYGNGAIEEYSRLGLADLIIDIVCSGKTMKKYNLKEYYKFFYSNIVVIKPQSRPNFRLNDLYKIIQQKINNPNKNSYTSRLISNPNELKRKLIEEAGEVITADSKENLIWECSDLLYFLFIIMARDRVTIEDIEKENERRNKETLLNNLELNKLKKGND